MKSSHYDLLPIAYYKWHLGKKRFHNVKFVFLQNATTPHYLLYRTHLVWQRGREGKNSSLKCRFFGQALQQTLLQKMQNDSATARSIRSCRSALGRRFAPTRLNSAGRLPQAVIQCHVAGHCLCLRRLKNTAHTLLVSNFAWRGPLLYKVVKALRGCDGNCADCCFIARGNTA